MYSHTSMKSRHLWLMYSHQRDLSILTSNHLSFLNFATKFKKFEKQLFCSVYTYLILRQKRFKQGVNPSCGVKVKWQNMPDYMYINVA